jgi:leader peptidase (prepilin peptidase) / N-methyltransferase
MAERRSLMRFDIPWVFLIPYLFALGATIGSFLNVCVYRLPKHDRLRDQIRGLLSPPSHCPRCGRRILLRDNLPVFGWLRLLGRCRFCRTRISPRYPIIEAANGLLFVVMFLSEVPTGSFARIEDSCLFASLGPHAEQTTGLFSPLMICFWRWLYHMVLIESLVVASLIDFDLRFIPDGATLPAMAVGILGSVIGCVYIVPVWFQDASLLHTLVDVTGSRFSFMALGPPVPHWIALHPHWHGLAVSLAGLVVGGGSIWIVRIIGRWVLKREAMGFGDVILMGTIGSFLGWQPTLMVFFLAALCALVVVAASWIFRRDREIPYGPYLSLATLVVILGWKQIWPSMERFFSLGLFVPAMAVLMCVLLYFTLQFSQLIKRLLGIPDELPEEELDVWGSADQLFHFSGGIGQADGWKRTQWPGVGAGRGSLVEQRWRNGSK